MRYASPEAAARFSKPWKNDAEFFQGLENLPFSFPRFGKNRGFGFQGLETGEVGLLGVAGYGAGWVRRVGDPAYSSALSFSVGRVSDSAALRLRPYRRRHA